MATNFGKFRPIKIPPESTGASIHNLVYISLGLNTVVGAIADGNSIEGVSSGVVGNIVEIRNGSVLIHVEADSPAQDFILGETVNIGVSTTAIIGETDRLYVSATTLVSADDPYNAQKVGSGGAAYVRFQEGNQQLDAFGLSSMSQKTVLDGFAFMYSENASELHNDLAGSATLTHLPNESCASFNLTTAPGDRVTRTTDMFYPYIPGVSREALFTLAIGDSGKAGCVRRWGLFSDDDGTYFELDGTTLYTVIRSSTSGSPVETRVAQADWNGDRVNGDTGVRNLSLMNLDVTKFNIYWMDYAWLGAGRVRFGVYAPNGERLVLHAWEHPNSLPTVYMRTGSLPIRWETFNTALTSGSSSMKTACASISNSTIQQVPSHPQVYSYLNGPTTLASGGGEVLIFSLQAAATYNGRVNRIVSKGIEQTSFSDAEAVIIRVYSGGTITGPSWSTINPLSGLQVDTVGSHSGGYLAAATIVGPGQSINSTLEFMDIHLEADASESEHYTVTAENIGATSTDAVVTFSWIDRG